MIFPVLIDNCTVLSVKVRNLLFVLNGELILITLNEKCNTTYLNLRVEFVLFYATPFLVQKSVFIEWC